MAQESVANERRRSLREELNRTLILDAAEETFAELGYKGASVRDIAGRAGFSTAAVYLFFENKQDLYTEMLLRRGAEVHEEMAKAATDDAASSALDKLHAMADVALTYYRQWPNFAQLVARAHATMLGSPLSEWGEHPDPHVRQQYERAMEFEASVIRQGQARGEVRQGDPRALAHLFSVLVNSYLAIGTPDELSHPSDGNAGLTVAQLHQIIDSVLRSPAG